MKSSGIIVADISKFDNISLERFIARGLKGIVKNTTWRCYSQVKSEAGKYSEVILDERAVADDKVYKLVKKTTK